MSFFSSMKSIEKLPKVHNFQYIRTENEDKQDEGIKPAAPATPDQSPTE